jgi:hypothetical protein
MNIAQKIGMGLLILGLVTPAIAAKKKAAKTDPAMDAQMQQAMKLGSPSEHHKVLDPLAGKFDVAVRGWMKPGDKPMESKGTSDHAWIYGGRFLKQEFKGDWAGQPFEGMGFTGYDNVRGEYTSIWLDSMSTAVMNATGNYDAASKTLKLGGTFSCAMTSEKARPFRSDWQIIDNNKSIYTSYHHDDKGQEYKAMEIVYTRVP